MKKILFSFLCFFVFTAWISAQVIADFEPNLTFHSMANGSKDSLTAFSIVSNPTGSDDPLNFSRWVMKFHRMHDGDPWAGFWSNLKTPIDMTTRKYIRVDVLKHRISPFHAKVEGGTTTPSQFELPAINTQTDTGVWVTMVFYFPNATGTYPIFDFMPDFLPVKDSIMAHGDQEIYFDNMLLCKDSLGTDSVVIENFEEILPVHSMANGYNDNETAFSVVPNPKSDATNNSTWVMKFQRAFDGDPWAGFWCPDSNNLTTNKFVTVDILKPDSSGTKFKFEGGPTTPATFELWNTRGQQKVGSWDRIPYSFPDATGEYHVIALMPDWVDKGVLTKDNIIYFDNIVLQATAPLSVKQISSGKDKVYCYPNPIQSSLYLDNLKAVDRIVIYNTIGQEVLSFRDIKTSRYEINASSLQRGMYIISVYNKSGDIITSKIIKE